MSETSAVLIIGGNSDIGRAVARAYAMAGRPIVLAARDSGRIERDAEDLRLRGNVTVRHVEFDVLDLASHAAFLDQFEPFPGTVVSAVGLLGDQAASAQDPVAADLVMRTNFLAPALLLGAVANRMEKRGSGTIIGISSIAGDRGRASNYVYGAGKAGFTAFLSGLRNRLSRTGVHVVTVKPGFVETRMTANMQLPPLVTAQPDEVARAIVAAEAKRRNVVYVRPIWRLIMAIIRALPESIFKKTKL